MRKIYGFVVCLFIGCGLYAQSLVSVSPASASKGQTLDIDIVGSGTRFASASSTVLIFQQASPTSSIVVNSVSAQSATKIRVNITIGSAANTGIYSIAVFNALDNTLFLNNSFTVSGSSAAPKIIQVNPNTGYRSQKLTVDITGSNTNFMSASTTLTVFRQASPTIEFINTDQVIIYSSTHIQAKFDVASGQTAGTYNVMIYTPDNGMLTLPNAFTVIGPTITNISPGSGNRNQSLSLNITGSNVNFQQGTNTVKFFRQGTPTAEVTSVFNTALSSTSLFANASIAANARYGYYDVEVTNQYAGTMNYPSGFYVVNPSNLTISNMTPASGMRGKQLVLTITGSNTNFMQGSNVVQFFRGGSATTNVSVSNVNVLNHQTLTANVTIKNQAELGNYTVSVYNDYDGYISYANPFSVIPRNPRLLSVTPSSIKRGAKLTITITVENTGFLSASSTLLSIEKEGSTSSQINVLNWQAISETQLQAEIEADTNAQYGFRRIVVYSEYDSLLMLNNAIYVIDTTPPPPPLIGLTETNGVVKFKLYPNPTRTDFYIETVDGNEVLKVEISDVTGRMIYTENPEYQGGRYNINVSDALRTKGFYLVRIITNQGVGFSRIRIE